MKLRILIAIAFIMAAVGYCANAQGAGTATNQVTLYWTPPAPMQIPFLYRVYYSTNLLEPMPWANYTNLPTSTVTNFTTSVAKYPTTYFYVVTYCATNTTWISDPSNTALTLWPNPSGLLGIRQGQ